MRREGYNIPEDIRSRLTSADIGTKTRAAVAKQSTYTTPYGEISGELYKQLKDEATKLNQQISGYKHQHNLGLPKVDTESLPKITVDSIIKSYGGYKKAYGQQAPEKLLEDLSINITDVMQRKDAQAKSNLQDAMIRGGLPSDMVEEIMSVVYSMGTAEWLGFLQAAEQSGQVYDIYHWYNIVDQETYEAQLKWVLDRLGISYDEERLSDIAFEAVTGVWNI